MEKFKAWGIRLDKNGLMGRFWFGTPLEHNRGCKVALFETRTIARKNLKYMKAGNYVPYPKAKVLRVEITVKECLNG